MKWKDLLADKTQFPDDFVVAVKVNGKDESLSLGDMRAYDTETKGALTADLTRRESELSRREKNVNDASISLASTIEQLAAKQGLSVDDFIAGKSPTKRQVAAATDLDESDPLVGSLVKEIKGMKAQLESVAADNQKLRKEALGPMLNTYLEDYYETNWENRVAPSLPKGSKVTREQAIEFANKNGLKDSKGRFDLARAAKELTFDDRVNEAAETRAAELRKKLDDERALAAAPRPSSLGQRVKTDKSLLNDKGRTKDFDEVLNDALGDSDLWKGIQNVQ